MRYSFVSPRDHIWSQWRFVLTTVAVSVASPTISPPLIGKTQREPTQKREEFHIFFMFCNIISSLSEYLLSQNVVENCVEPLTCPMPNIFFFFPFVPRRKISPQNPIMPATGSHLFKGKNSIQKKNTHSGQHVPLPHPCTQPDDCGYQIEVVMRS